MQFGVISGAISGVDSGLNENAILTIKKKIEESDFDLIKADIIPFVKSNYNVDNINKEMFINSLCYLKSDE